jgi:hypothetical protein
MTDDTSKLDQLFAQLTPYIDTRIEEKLLELGIRKRITQPRNAHRRSRKAREKNLYTPEIDFLLDITARRQEFRKAQITNQGMLKALPTHTQQLKTFIGLDCNGYYDPETHITERKIAIPTKTLTQYITSVYGVSPIEDYRCNPAKTVYFGDVADVTDQMRPMNSPASSYVFEMGRPLTEEILENTRAYWESMGSAEERGRIIDRELMLFLLDRLERGEWVVGAVPWRVLTDMSGRDLSKKKDFIPMEDYAWLQPRKVGFYTVDELNVNEDLNLDEEMSDEF